MELNLERGRAARDTGIAKVSCSNETFLETMRGVARLFCQRNGQATADDLRKWADENGVEPTHPSAWGAVFRTPEFEAVGLTPSKQFLRHGNRNMVWKLRQG